MPKFCVFFASGPWQRQHIRVGKHSRPNFSAHLLSWKWWETRVLQSYWGYVLSDLGTFSWHCILKGPVVPPWEPKFYQMDLWEIYYTIADVILYYSSGIRREQGLTSFLGSQCLAGVWLGLTSALLDDSKVGLQKTGGFWFLNPHALTQKWSSQWDLPGKHHLKVQIPPTPCLCRFSHLARL